MKRANGPALRKVQLARKIGEAQTFVSKCERGERRVDVVELRTFCRAFGLDLKLFVGTGEDAERARRQGASKVRASLCQTNDHR